MTYDDWKTAPPEDLLDCSDCGEPVPESHAKTIPAWMGGDGQPLCPECHEQYHPDL